MCLSWGTSPWRACCTGSRMGGLGAGSHVGMLLGTSWSLFLVPWGRGECGTQLARAEPAGAEPAALHWPETLPGRGDLCPQEEGPGAPEVRGSVQHRRNPLGAASLPLPHLHYRLLQPVERGENLWEGRREGSTAMARQEGPSRACAWQLGGSFWLFKYGISPPAHTLTPQPPRQL